MSNYSVKEAKIPGLIGYIKKDSSRGNLENFLEVKWNVEEYYRNPVEISNKEEEIKDKSCCKIYSDEFIEKVVLCLILICHSTVRGCQEFIKVIFDKAISLDRISKIVNKSGEKAKEFNKKIELSGIKEGALDEIFIKNLPILVGVCLKSSYIFMLDRSEGRSGADWGIELLKKQEEQELNLEITVTDQGRGLCKGIGEAYPEAEQEYDHFHNSKKVLDVLRSLENQGYKSIDKVEKIEDKYLKSLEKKEGRKYGKKYKILLDKMEKAIDLYDNFRVLFEWLRETLSLYAPSYEERLWTYNYIVREMKESDEENKKIKSLVKHLENNKEEILCFARILEERLNKFREESNYDLTQEDLHNIYRQLTLSEYDCKYWNLEVVLRAKFGRKLPEIQDKVKDILNSTFKASSIVENVNSIIRPYLSIRKNLGRSNFLNLLQFYLNNKAFQRCKDKEREGKTRLELLTGEKHPFWLEALGYDN